MRRRQTLAVLVLAGAALLGAGWPHPGGGFDGNRLAAGRGTFPAWREALVAGAVPAWVVVLPSHRKAVADRLRRLETAAAEQGFDVVDRTRLERCAQDVRAALERRWTPTSDAAV